MVLTYRDSVSRVSSIKIVGPLRMLPVRPPTPRRARSLLVPIPRLANEAKAAAHIGLEIATLRAWVADGRLPRPLPHCDKYDWDRLLCGGTSLYANGYLPVPPPIC